MFGKKQFTQRDAEKTLQRIAARRALYQLIWERMEAGRPYPSPCPLDHDDRYVRDFLKDILKV